MTKWNVTITETLTRTIEVDADAESKEAAIEAVRDRYKRGEIILGTDDYCGTEFDAHENEEDEE